MLLRKINVHQSENHLILSWRRPISYRNQSIDLLCKSMDWFLYDIGLRYERVKKVLRIIFRSNCSELFCKKGVLKNFAILLKKRFQQRRFPVNFAKFLFYRTPPVATSIFYFFIADTGRRLNIRRWEDALDVLGVLYVRSV